VLKLFLAPNGNSSYPFLFLRLILVCNLNIICIMPCLQNVMCKVKLKEWGFLEINAHSPIG
jgi:hypothetical protein